MASDTIFALSTGSGAAGIAVIRITGPETSRVLELVAGGLPLPRQAVLRMIRDPTTRDVIDSGVVLFFKGPNSFTGEDLAELQVHGSLAVIRHILRCLGELPGLRAAEAGEFSYRAFLNGKMDLLAVEALGDLLVAETEAQARLARLSQSNLRAAALDWRESLLSVSSLTEAGIDFSDESDVSEEVDSIAKQEIKTLSAVISGALKSLATGERIRRGFRIAVLGLPNAGKSSLVNAIANRDVAITSAIPGTTRDTIEVHLDLKGLPVILIDTAGLRESDDLLEQAGIERARLAADGADLVLWLSSLEQLGDCPFPEALVVHSKADVFDSPALRSQQNLYVSTTTSEGLAELIEVLHQRAAKALYVGGESILVAHGRQAGELRSAVAALDRAASHGVDSTELRAEELRIARHCLDRLTGRIGYEEVLGAIFSRFCIGK